MKSKQVLIIIPHLGIGGTEVQTFSLANALVSNGYRVSLLCLYRHVKNVEDKFTSIGVELLLLSPEYNDYVSQIKYPTGLKLITFLYKGLKKSLRVFNPDIIHVQYVTPGATIILMLKYLFGFRIILATSHTNGDIYSKNGIRLIRFLTNNCLKTFQCITEVAERSYFGSSNLFNGKLTRHLTIHNNIPSHIDILSTPRRKKDEKAQIVVGVVSRLEHIKGMDLVVPAFAEALKGNLHLRLLVVGDGSQRALMQQQVADLGVADKVEFVGRQPQSALQDYYDRIDILLMPSRSEGFGLTAIEGMARGCVPVVANVGGLPEVVSNDTGVVIGAAQSMGQTIIQLSSDLDRLRKLSYNGIIRAKQFDSENYRNKIHCLYTTIQ